MVGTIGPVVHGRSIKYPQWVYLHVFVAANAIGGALTGLVLSLPGSILQHFRQLDAASVAPGLLLLGAFGSLRDGGLLRFNVPISTWQVPRRWSLLPAGTMAILYGTILGSGLFTRISSSAFYVVVTGCVFLGDPALSIILFLLYAVSKGLTVIVVIEVYLRRHQKRDQLLLRTAELSKYVPLASAAAIALFTCSIASTLLCLMCG